MKSKRKFLKNRKKKNLKLNWCLVYKIKEKKLKKWGGRKQNKLKNYFKKSKNKHFQYQKLTSIREMEYSWGI